MKMKIKTKILIGLGILLIIFLGFIILYDKYIEAVIFRIPESDHYYRYPGRVPPRDRTPAEVPPIIYGITVDDTSKLSLTLDSITRLSQKTMVRIVFDYGMNPVDYSNAVNQIDSIAYTMAEPVDSSDMTKYSTYQYSNRFSQYLSAFGNQIEIWEIGNEVNGEWLGNATSVSDKIAAAYDLVKAAGKKTALTLHYNVGGDCPTYPVNEMYSWVNKYVPERMRQGVDYVFFSYYPENCPEISPNWELEFQKIGNIFPNSKLGFGELGYEVGTQAQKEALIKRFYPMKINHPRYVKGIFWWYFKEEMVPYTSYLWGVLNKAIGG